MSFTISMQNIMHCWINISLWLHCLYCLFFLKLIVFLYIALCAAIIKFFQNSLSQNFKEPLNTLLFNHVLKSIRWPLVLCLALHPPSSCSSLHPQVLLPKISFCFSSSLDLLFLESYVLFLSLSSLLAKPSPAGASWERMKGKSPHC